MHKSAQLILLCIAVVMLQLAQAQRPSYAGSRPSGGLNQKDKYHTPDDVSTRFGSSGNNATPASTPPPAAIPPPSHVPVVFPESVYVPLPTPANADFELTNRFGGNGASATANANANGAPQPLPLDAHGDRDLINQLNRIPEDRRPFWFLNYQAIEAQRNSSIANSPGGIGARGSFFG